MQQIVINPFGFVAEVGRVLQADIAFSSMEIVYGSKPEALTVESSISGSKISRCGVSVTVPET